MHARQRAAQPLTTLLSRARAQGSELRLEVKDDATVSVMVRLCHMAWYASCAVRALQGSLQQHLACGPAQLTTGQAEIFGTTLITGQALTLRGHKVAVRAPPCGETGCASRFVAELTDTSPTGCAATSPGLAHGSACRGCLVDQTALSWSCQIYTWDGCTVDVITEDYPIAMATDMVYTSDETPMVSYLNTHQARGLPDGGSGCLRHLLGPIGACGKRRAKAPSR